MFYSGWCADKINVWLARRNNGVHKPEHHLLHLIVPTISGIIGIVTIAVCAQHPERYSAWGMVVGTRSLFFVHVDWSLIRSRLGNLSVFVHFYPH